MTHVCTSDLAHGIKLAQTFFQVIELSLVHAWPVASCLSMKVWPVILRTYIQSTWEKFNRCLISKSPYKSV